MTEAGSRSGGLYIHVPFCLRKCRYCDFLSVPLTGSAILDDYCQCLLKEIAGCSTRCRLPDIETVYFGGGTPSLLSAMQIEQIILALRRYFSFQDAEITLEANPATLSRAKIKDLQNAGINRISLGVQSFCDVELNMLGRVHSARDALASIDDLRALDWDNYNIDLIYGLPGQSIDRWEKNLEQAVSCEPDHISAYLLQLDSSTPLAVDLARGLRQPAGEENEEAMFKLTREYLQAEGYGHYEISNYCRPGRECRHNLIYWSVRDYLGLGSGAVSFNNSRRWINPWPVESYCDSLQSGHLPCIRVLENLKPDDLVAESLVMGLRLTEGVDLDDIKARWEIDPRQRYGPLLDSFISRGWLMRQGNRIFLHPDMIFVSNQILCHFI